MTLSYVVTETLEGRADAIKAKTIAHDLYGRSLTTDGDPENVVRVDARRLRRRLSDYYDSEGKDASVRIHIDSGGYVPRFEIIDLAPTESDLYPERPQIPGIIGALIDAIRQRSATVAFVGCILLAISLTAAFVFLEPPSDPVLSRKDAAERLSLLDKSPNSLLAVEMAEQAIPMTFPITDRRRQELAQGFFQRAIELAPDYSGGYAGAALTYGALALISIDPTERQKFGDKAMAMALKSLDLSPRSALSQSAGGWVYFVHGDYDKAMVYLSRANALAPDDLYILARYAYVANANGSFDLVRQITDPNVYNFGTTKGTGIRISYAIANFFLGKYQEAERYFQLAKEHGEPIAAVPLAIEVATLQALGEHEQARGLLNTIQENFPGISFDKRFEAGFRNKKHAQKIIRWLKNAGWEPPDKLPHTNAAQEH